jgi:hypothetical protein
MHATCRVAPLLAVDVNKTFKLYCTFWYAVIYSFKNFLFSGYRRSLSVENNRKPVNKKNSSSMDDIEMRLLVKNHGFEDDNGNRTHSWKLTLTSDDSSKLPTTIFVKLLTKIIWPDKRVFRLIPELRTKWETQRR